MHTYAGGASDNRVTLTFYFLISRSRYAEELPYTKCVLSTEFDVDSSNLFFFQSANTRTDRQTDTGAIDHPTHARVTPE